jgi:hypothetical protein
LVYLSILLFPNSYVILLGKSIHCQLSLPSRLLREIRNHIFLPSWGVSPT